MNLERSIANHYSLSDAHTFCVCFIGPPDHELTPAQVLIMKQAMSKSRETVQRLATDHRDLHSTVSKVGKAIDRVLILFKFIYIVV